MAEEKDQSGGFKVVDRRSFAADGSRISPGEEAPERNRADGPARPLDLHGVAGAEKTSAPRGRSAPLAATPEADFGQDTAGGPSGFETLVSYLSTTALFQLGLLDGPSGERIPADLPNARRTIALLEALQEKTQGNLTDAETRLLEDVLYELRVSFVELQKRGAPRR